MVVLLAPAAALPMPCLASPCCPGLLSSLHSRLAAARFPVAPRPAGMLLWPAAACLAERTLRPPPRCVLSLSSSCRIEEVAFSCDSIRFYQLYMCKRRDVSATLVRRAESLGFKAVVLTVDRPVLGRREADIRNKMIAPRFVNLEDLMSLDNDIDSAEGGSKLERFSWETLDPSLSWKDVEWLKSVTRLPILPKGILTAEDARKAVEAGAAGVIVSNHGARQLDYALAVLEEVVKAVVGGVPVLVDGGVRRGTDVALALGATAVMVGRPVFYGLAARGEAGARHVIEMLNEELELAMALCGPERGRPEHSPVVSL
ncbi:peroxisomal (S)-2-hydroxy-acid oxidase GLO4-like [Miscanthus floridulus]|uniref:peroxisomal (S)-2-hydroxy-acid oxidase GLO4-like n=1 Tax=Miscanthus floridulus TaxID=154761 RepID=UPI00345A40D3